ncbi:MAG: 4-hydroxythreonine-4-phosphate dehydrogenase PdxA [Gemmataceae bacterium]|nr:4-hydroxythreonine-4-phosphate dehydrogenase PdxA [Gemmataceae bacterium]
MGDPAGVGPELCLRLLADPGVREACVPIVYGDFDVLNRVGQKLHLALPKNDIGLDVWPELADDIKDPAILDFAHLDAAAVQPGHVDVAGGSASFLYVDAALSDARRGRVAGICTAPIQKEAWAAAGVPFAGHTDFLAQTCGVSRHGMMLTSDVITCTVVTTHVGLRDVPDLLTSEKIVDAIELTAETMQKLRGHKPRLVVLGLNPHAGEGGLFGAGEEESIIIPAIETALQRGITVEGPVPPDTAFLKSRRETTDAYVCMYHDQGLIPLKALAFDSAVNLTLGLPVVRTSPDHGTAYDRAWQGTADPSSFRAAVLLAARLAM